MWKQSPFCAPSLAWIGAIALIVGAGCANSTLSGKEALRIKQADSHLNLGLDYINSGRVAVGLRELLRAERFDERNPRIQQALGDAYMLRSKPDKAEQHYREALAIDPSYHDARMNLSTLYTQLDRYEESIAQASILVDDPTYADTWRALANKGLSEFRLGRREQARSSLELALEYRDDYLPALLYLGTLEVEEGRQLEGLSLFRQVLAQEPGLDVQAQANYRIGEIYVALGRRDQAAVHFRAAVVQAPGGPWGVKAEENLILLR